MIVRKASPNDIPQISSLIDDASEYGVLLKRSEEELQLDIDEFWIMEDNGLIIACRPTSICAKLTRQLGSTQIRELVQLSR